MNINGSLDNMPLVSVIIGTYNRELLLKRCLDSIEKQTYKNIEIIIIDDYSSDNTSSMLKDFEKNSNRDVIVHTNFENKGIAYNSNKGFELSSGRYIALIGDDDTWSSNTKIEQQVAAMEEAPDLALVGTFWSDVKGGKVIARHSPIVSQSPVCQILKRNGVYCGSSVLIRSEAWKSVGGFDEKLKKGTDSDLFRNLIVSGYKSKVLAIYTTEVFVDDHPRMTPTVSNAGLEKDILSHIRCLEKYKDAFRLCKKSRRIRKYILLKRILRLVLKTKNPSKLSYLSRLL